MKNTTSGNAQRCIMLLLVFLLHHRGRGAFALSLFSDRVRVQMMKMRSRV